MEVALQDGYNNPNQILPCCFSTITYHFSNLVLAIYKPLKIPSYHMNTLLLHILNSILVYRLLDRTLLWILLVDTQPKRHNSNKRNVQYRWFWSSSTTELGLYDRNKFVLLARKVLQRVVVEKPVEYGRSSYSNIQQVAFFYIFNCGLWPFLCEWVATKW